jgi:hypothetical protein
MDLVKLLDDANEIKKTSSEWIKEVGYEVIDPDGWNRSDFQNSWYEEMITYQEFQKRLLGSTLKRKFKN